jgi:hypothetical protein
VVVPDLQDSVGVASGTQTATMTIATGGTLGTIYVPTTGQPNLDYTFVSGGTCTTGTVYAVNATCTVNYDFTAKAPGQRLGAVQLVANDNATILGTALLTGTGAALVFPGNPTILPLGGGFNDPTGVAVDGAGNVYVADTGSNAVKEIPLATPPSLSFSSTSVGSTSSDRPQTLLLQNIGNAALSFPAPGTGNNPSISTNFVLGGSSTCPLGTAGSPGSLAAGTCTEFISFTPTTAGSISGALVFTDNSLSAGNNGMQSVPLNGTATASVAATQAIASTTLTQNHAATSFTLVTGSGGTGTRT